MQNDNDMVKTNYLAVQNKYLDQISKLAEKQYKAVASQVIKDICNSASKNADAHSLETHLDLALDLLLDLKHAVNGSHPVWNKNEKLETLYTDFNWSDDLNPWVHDPETINIITLNDIINKYLSYEWFSSPVFEHVIVNAYLRYCIDSNRKKIIFSPPMSARSWAACCTTKMGYFKTYIPLKIIGIIMYWIIPIWLLIHSLINGWLITLIFSGIFICYSIISVVTQKITQMHQCKTLFALIGLKNYITGKTWSPAVAIAKIKKLDKIFNMPELMPMISKISNQNPDIFNVTHT